MIHLTNNSLALTGTVFPSIRCAVDGGKGAGECEGGDGGGLGDGHPVVDKSGSSLRSLDIMIFINIHLVFNIILQCVGSCNFQWVYWLTWFINQC